MQYIQQTYRIYPTKEQQNTINQWIGNARFVWNYMLSNNIKEYNENKKFIFEHNMNKILPELKKEYEWLKSSPSQTLQQKCQDLDTQLKRKFKNVSGFPKFKSKRTDSTSIRIPQGWHFEENRINLPKLKGIKIKKHREINGKAGHLTVKRDKDGNYYVIILYQIKQFQEPSNVINNAVGIDLGIKEFQVTSDCEIIKNPTLLKKSQKRIIKEQRKLSRKQKGSNNRNKQRTKLAKAHNKVARQRNDFIKKHANSIAKNYGLVSVEDLDIKGMLMNGNLSEQISDVGWGMFLTELEWQCRKHSQHFVRIDRYYPSSKNCSQCGWKNEFLTLSDRIFNCGNCNLELDRDLNASINILNQGLKKIGQELPELTPLEI